MTNLQWRLKPIHTSTYVEHKLYDKIVIYDEDDYPLAMVFVDDFDSKKKNEIHTLLNKGREIIISLELVKEMNKE